MKIPSTPTATAVLPMHGINSRRPPLATPPPSNCMKKQNWNNDKDLKNIFNRGRIKISSKDPKESFYMLGKSEKMDIRSDDQI